jgi:hypothetical protein
MPYIKQDYRTQLDAEIEAFISKVKEIHAANPEQTRDGLLNYFKLCLSRCTIS